MRFEFIFRVLSVCDAQLDSERLSSILIPLYYPHDNW